MEQFKGQTRLPKFAVPKRYDLSLKIDLSACTFTGSVRIDLRIVEETKFIVLNALELDINEVCFIDAQNQKHCPSNVVLVLEDEIIVLVFDNELAVGDGILGIDFSAALNKHLKGFYKGTYMDGGERKNMAATQFEAVDARRCFPCWDEPALKATFKITLDVPSQLTALSNMPVIEEKLDGEIKTFYFEETPLMSTYLVAFVIGLFDHIEEVTAGGIKVRSYCPVGKSEKGKFALSLAVKALDLFTEYFATPYPLPKLDMVAVPDFAAGAMENYGLITYRETEMLFDELLSTAANKQRLTIVTAHEVAHMWFGNLVTMEWWTHLWLNEGFATWISYSAADSWFPEWKTWTQFLKQTSDGLHMDALEQSHPIEVEVQRARLVEESFDAIGYYKGSAVVRMLQDYLGDDVFRKSLSSYMKKYAYKNATTDDLWSVLSEESGVQVNNMMDTWTKQTGYPVISVRSKGHLLEFEQTQFLFSGLHGDNERQWIVPINLCVSSYEQRSNFLLGTKQGNFDLSELLHGSDKNQEQCNNQLWVKVNIEQAGFYRVKYDDELASRLRKAAENNWLSASDKFGILDDTYALCKAGELPLSSFLYLIDVYRKELDYIVLSKLIDIFYDLAKISVEAIPESQNELKQFFINVLCYSAEKLGWEPIFGESHLSALARGEVLMALATLGHDKTQEAAFERFQLFLADRDTPFLSSDTRRAAYITVMRNSSIENRSGFDALLNVFREADVVQERTRVLRSLASSPDPNLVVESLNLLLSGEIREQDVIFVLPGISLEGREAAWGWFKESWDLILKKWGDGMLLTHFIRDIILPFCSYKKADEIEEFFATRLVPAVAMNYNQSMEQVRIKARWAQNIKQEQSLQQLIKELASKE